MEEQRLFRLLGAFFGGCTLPAAESVAQERGVLDTLSSLVDKGLVYPQDVGTERRYRMLETVHEFALEELRASAEYVTIRNRHARLMLDSVSRLEAQLWGPPQPDCLAQLAAEQDNVRAALRWCFDQQDLNSVSELLRSLLYFWWLRGQMSEALRWSEEVLASREQCAPLARARPSHVAAFAMTARGDFAHGAQLIEKALRIYEAEHDEWGKGHCLILKGFLSPVTASVPEGMTWLEEARKLLADASDERGSGFALSGLSALAVRAGDPAAGVEFARRRLELTRAMGDPQGTAQALDDLAAAALMLQDYETVAAALNESLPVSLDLGQSELAAYGLMGLATVAAAEQRFRQAARLFGAAEAARDACGVAICGRGWRSRPGQLRMA